MPVRKALTPDELEEKLRRIGQERYHDKHPFHQLLHEGKLDKGQVQAWALNRYYYQSRIPIKDAALMSRLDDSALRCVWRQRIADHDGVSPGSGGLARWLRLAEGLGLDAKMVQSMDGVLPATRFAVDAYVQFVRDRSVLEAVASSLTELFSPGVIARRVEGMLANYDFVSRGALSYFAERLNEAPRDAAFALEFVKREATQAHQQSLVLQALIFKCDVLWAQLDALYYAYVAPGHVPVGAFRPRNEAAAL